MLHDQEEVIANWFHEARSDPFAKYVCDARINGCNAQVAAAFSARQDDGVEVEDDDTKAPPKKPEASKQERKVEKKVPPPPTQKKEEPHHSSESPSLNPKDFVMTIVNRIKANMQRIYRLSTELYKEVRPLVSGRKWEQLGKMAKDVEFYRKYWIVFAAFIFAIYFIVSLLEPLFASKAPKTRPAGSKRKTAAKAKKEN